MIAKLLVISTIPKTHLDVSDIGDAIVHFFTSILASIGDMLMAIPNAITKTFETWATLLGETWYGPILMGIVIMTTIMIVYAGYFVIDTFFN